MQKEKYGFVYIWFDKKNKMYYIGSHWGFEDDGYICSSPKMLRAYARRKEDFKRRILKSGFMNRQDLLKEEDRWLSMIDPYKTITSNTKLRDREKNVRYYNINLKAWESWHHNEERNKTIGEKISASKTGKSVPCTPEKAAAISAAKKGKKLTEEHKAALRGKKKPHTDEWKVENSKRMKEQWSINSPRRQAVSEATKKRWEEYRKNKLETAV